MKKHELIYGITPTRQPNRSGHCCVCNEELGWYASKLVHYTGDIACVHKSHPEIQAENYQEWWYYTDG